MSYKIGIVGCGNVGISYAYSLLNQGLDISEIILIDIDEKRTRGKALDLCHSLAFSRGYINNVKYGDYNDISDADILCITAGASQSSKKASRMEDLIETNEIINIVMKNVNKAKFDGIIIVASNPLDIITLKIAKLYNNDFKRVIGSGTLLDTARLRYEIADKLDFPVRSISGFVFGEHGDSQLVAWSSVKVNNEYNIKDYLTEKDMLEIEESVKRDGFKVSSLQGYTCFGIATALSKITRCIINNEKEELPISTYDYENEVYISSLSILGSNGVEDNKLYILTKKEEELYNISANIIKDGAKSINI
jgi:L-lactate dehydrogenase